MNKDDLKALKTERESESLLHKSSDQKILQKKKRKKSRSSSTSSTSSSTSSTSSTSSSTSSTYSSSSTSLCSPQKELKKRKKKREKRLKKKLEKLKEKLKKKKRKRKKVKDAERIPVQNLSLPNDDDDDVIGPSACLIEASKLRAPMTKEEWDKQQSRVSRVLDPETGRYRLIKGTGEVLEECVSRERHLAINKAATRGDGNFFQSTIMAKLKKS